MADVFISYSRNDRDAVTGIAEAIEAAGYSVWWDRLIEGGSEFSADIEKELDAATVAVVIWSSHSRVSRWVKDEASSAADLGKIIPVSLDGDPAPMGFRQFQLVDFKDWDKSPNSPETESLVRIIAGRLGEDAPAPNYAPSPVVTQSFFKNRRNQLLIGAVILAAFAGLASVLLSSAPERVAPSREIVTDLDTQKSVAVLPFTTFTDNDENEFFALGLHDEVLTQLAKIADMRVISRTSVMSYRDSGKTIPEIAAELGVAMIMEGSVNRIGEKIRINVKLFDAAKEQLVWEDTADTVLAVEDLFNLQTEITTNIARELGAVMTGAEQSAIATRPTQNTAAYDAYLKGKWAGRYGDATEAGFIDAIVLFDEAISLDPLFAEAYAEKAVAHLSLYWSGREKGKNLEAAQGRAGSSAKYQS